MFKFKYHCGNIWAPKSPNGTTLLRIDPNQLEKWMHQNKAEYTGDYIEGCLLDNFVVATRRGYAAIYANPVTEWTSDYYIEFQPGAAPDVWRRWYDFANNMEVAQ